MNDEHQEQPQEQPQAASSPFVEELTKLGRNFSHLIKDALESPQLQEMRKEVATGAQTVIEEINEAMVKARESQVTQNMAQKAAKTADEIRTSPVTGNIKTGLLNALKSVNQELNGVVQRMEQSQQAPAPEATPAENAAPDSAKSSGASDTV